MPVQSIIPEDSKSKEQDFIPISINYISPIKIPSGTDKWYGNNWPSELVKEFIIPNLNVDTSLGIFKGIQIDTEIHDQGFGGTGHINLRCFINNIAIKPLIWIDREDVPSGIYSFLIENSTCKLSTNDKVQIWLCCPAWNGWSANMKTFKLTYKYE